MNTESAILKRYEKYISGLETEKEAMQQIIQAQEELIAVQKGLIQQLTELGQMHGQTFPELRKAKEGTDSSLL